MSMERSRRDRFTSVAPTSGELLVAAGCVTILCLLLTPLIVQGTAAWACNGEFAWPSGRLLDAYHGLLCGQFGAGLGDAAGDLPPDPVMWPLTALGELLALGAAVVGGTWMRNHAGTNARHGLATPAQAAEALGLPRLRHSAAVIRPDLYRPDRHRPNVPRPGRRTVPGWSNTGGPRAGERP